MEFVQTSCKFGKRVVRLRHQASSSAIPPATRAITALSQRIFSWCRTAHGGFARTTGLVVGLVVGFGWAVGLNGFTGVGAITVGLDATVGFAVGATVALTKWRRGRHSRLGIPTVPNPVSTTGSTASGKYLWIEMTSRERARSHKPAVGVRRVEPRGAVRQNQVAALERSGENRQRARFVGGRFIGGRGRASPSPNVCSVARADFPAEKLRPKYRRFVQTRRRLAKQLFWRCASALCVANGAFARWCADGCTIRNCTLATRNVRGADGDLRYFDIQRMRCGNFKPLQGGARAFFDFRLASAAIVKR